MYRPHFYKLVFVILVNLICVIHSSVAQDDSFDPSIVSTVQDDKGIWMVYLPEGTFTMGIDLDEALKLCPDLVPEKFVSLICTAEGFNEYSRVLVSQPTTVSPFYIDQFEVSLGEYLACVNADVCETDFLEREMEAIASGDDVPMDLPVIRADYYDAAIYCAWRGGRLPTEAEWEYAARGPESNSFPWGNEYDGTRTNVCDESCSTVIESHWNDGYPGLAPVDAYADGQSWAGIYNLSGNVAEWTSTRQIGENGFLTDSRVVKGGSFLSYPLESAAWHRWLYISGNSDNIGFRCARTTSP
jgi:formylglycine-generating enzyme required for sulfatase activity